MARIVDIGDPPRLEDYEAVAHLTRHVVDLRTTAEAVRDRLAGRRVWMVNSTARGGGVAEMLPTMISLMRGLGVETEWAVIESSDPGFFRLTKRVHNLIHGEGDPGIPPEAPELFESENRANAAFLSERMKPGDILVVHDPQPMPLARILKEDLDITAVWRCHIGLDEENEATRAAWKFLHPFTDAYEHGVFSTPEYVPQAFIRRASVITPAIDPLADKNVDLHLHKLVGVLANSAFATSPGPLVPPPFGDFVHRLQGDGSFRPANMWDDIGLLTRPIISQVSRWDRLKGWKPLLEAFVLLKQRFLDGTDPEDEWSYRRRMDLVRLVLAGPDPASIQDDPEGQEVVAELHDAYLELSPEIQDDVAVVTLPMSSRRQNALIVNALQRASTVVVQNSLREGFGLTVTEAMWKRIPVLTNSRACGPRYQVRDGVDGCLVRDPESSDELARTMSAMLGAHRNRDLWGRNAQRRVHSEFLVFRQVSEWLRLLGRLV
ncbi:MAG: glycosyltransferase, partial [Gemmatimonadota bacterium]|nr:glycosyltransferase [Gemmatimonadota bacterium]